MSNPTEKIPIGISSCLVGQKVRHDGASKTSHYITDTLGQYFDWISFCPEVSVGMGVPRPTIHLELIEEDTRLICPTTGEDWTERMKQNSDKELDKILKKEIFGYILKSKSPSCGMERVKIYRGHAIRPYTNGVGVHAELLKSKAPNLPVEEEGRLCDPILRENWINRVFAYYSFKKEVCYKPTVGKLVTHHSRWKFNVLSHCNVTYSNLGRLVANAKGKSLSEVLKEYENEFMAALTKRSTPSKHVNVMEHMVGFFKKKLDSKAKSSLHQSIEDYKSGYVPIIVPITLIRHYASLFGEEYLLEQSYLNPHPKELALLSLI